MNETSTAEVIPVRASTRARLAAISFVREQPDWMILEEALAKLLLGFSKRDRDFVQVFESKALHGVLIDRPVPNGIRLADRIREFVRVNYVAPARLRSERKLAIEVKEVHRQMGLTQRYAAVRAALRGREFLNDCGLQLMDSKGSSKVLTFKILKASNTFRDDRQPLPSPTSGQRKAG